MPCATRRRRCRVVGRSWAVCAAEVTQAKHALHYCICCFIRRHFYDAEQNVLYDSAGSQAHRDEAAQAVLASAQAEIEHDDELVSATFDFSTPSPDDVVLAARAGATGRAAPAAAPDTADVAASAMAARSSAETTASESKPAARSAKAAPNRAVAPRGATAAPSAADAAEGEQLAELMHEVQASVSSPFVP